MISRFEFGEIRGQSAFCIAICILFALPIVVFCVSCSERNALSDNVGFLQEKRQEGDILEQITVEIKNVKDTCKDELEVRVNHLVDMLVFNVFCAECSRQLSVKEVRTGSSYVVPIQPDSTNTLGGGKLMARGYRDGVMRRNPSLHTKKASIVLKCVENGMERDFSIPLSFVFESQTME